jgi:hypothetical protein
MHIQIQEAYRMPIDMTRNVPYHEIIVKLSKAQFDLLEEINQ